MRTICFGEILLRLSPVDKQRMLQTRIFEAEYGGSEANVAVSLALFGLESGFVTRLPDQELGRSATGAVARYGVSVDHVLFGGERMGIYFLEQGAGRRGSKVLYDRAASGMATLQAGMIDWTRALKGVSWLHWSGITPALSQNAAEAMLEALQYARKQDIKISCDLNYRASLWNYGKKPREVMPEMVALSDVMLGDQSAFKVCLGIQADDFEEHLDAVAAAYPRLSHLAVTRREGLSASHNTYQGILRFNGQQYESQTHDLPDMLDRIGSGDAFMAGLIYGLQQNDFGPQKAVEFAAAAAALKHYIPGDFNLCTVEEVNALMAGATGGKVKR